jgi:hypothetical protein
VNFAVARPRSKDRGANFFRAKCSFSQLSMDLSAQFTYKVSHAYGQILKTEKTMAKKAKKPAKKAAKGK